MSDSKILEKENKTFSLSSQKFSEIPINFYIDAEQVKTLQLFSAR